MWRLVLLGILLSCNGAAAAAGMSPVPPHTGFCVGKDDSICHEWTLVADPSVRLIAHGYEDGVDYGFFRLEKGHYTYLVRIYPVLQDAAHAGMYFWGYAWDIQDIALGDDGKALMATFDHSIVDDGEISSPAWQKRVPAVLFTGRTTQPHMTVPAPVFRPSSLAALRSGARR